MTPSKTPSEPAPHSARSVRAEPRAEEDALIVGAGPIGLACAVSARRRGWDPLIIDQGPIVHSIVRYPIGMTFFTTPELLEIGGHPFPCSGQKPTREEAIKYYRGVARREELRVLPYTAFRHAERAGESFRCELEGRRGGLELRARRLVLAVGYFDHPNELGVPGEDLPHVSHYFDEAHLSCDLDVAVIGGRNSAVEAALELFRAGARVTLIYRGKEFTPSVKYWMKPDIENRIAAGEITAHFESHVRQITPDRVVVEDGRGEGIEVAADRVYALTGYHPDEELFRRLGIRVDPETGRPEHDPDTLETNVSGLYLVGSPLAGRRTGDIFIENGRFDGEKVFSR